MAAESVSVPVPCLSSVEMGVSMGSDTATLPAPRNVMPGVPVDASNAFPLETLKVSVSASLATDAAALRRIAPVRLLLLVPLASILRIAPVDVTPVPEIVSGSPIEMPSPLTCNAAPESTVVPVPVLPSARPLLATTTPAEIVVAPV